MQPFQWSNGCLCSLGRQCSEHDYSMTSDIYHLPLNVYVIVLGIGLFVFMLSLIFCCYLFRLKQQGTREQFSYNEVVLKGASKKLSLLGQTCAVCLEEFRTRDELGVCPCSHAFHKKCLLKWLEIRSVCPMCNKPILRLHPDAPQGAEGPMDPEEFTRKMKRRYGGCQRAGAALPQTSRRRRGARTMTNLHDLRGVTRTASTNPDDNNASARATHASSVLPTLRQPRAATTSG
uniref:RING finger protein 122 n=1 Tax=Oryzias latipes TaxID=8090 RepID=A0A3P9H0K6_ORYLA